MSAPSGYEAINSPLHESGIGGRGSEQLEIESQERASKSLLGRGPNAANASSSSCSFAAIACSRYTYFILGYLVLVVSMLIGFYQLRQESISQYNEFNAVIARLQAQLDSVNQNSTTEYMSLKSNVMTFEDTTSSTLTTHTAMLTRLTNGTSNADVLDKLKATEANVNAQMLSMQDNMQIALLAATKNVSDQLAQENQELQQTQVDVNRHLNKTMIKMENVVSAAAANIYGVQQNVSAQLNNMRLSVSDTVNTLNAQVQAAQATIHDEVETVKTNINTYVAVTNRQFAAENDFVKYQLAGTFTLLGCLISMWHLTSHWRNYHKPDVQRRVMAVLWMVPIYSITSWLSLVVPSAESFLGAIRDCYEAYAIYTFIALLIAILEDGRGLAELIETITKHVIEERQAVADAIAINAKPPPEHIRPPFPCCYVYHKPTTVAAAWLFQCKLMAMQFVMLKPLLTVIPLILNLSGYDLDNIPWVIGESINWKSPKLYILFLENCSVAVAFWGLLCFYHGTEKDLEWCDPWPKFLCIKGVVFATFWQSLTIQTMSSFGLVDAHSANQVQNLLICIEMLIASLAHFYIFPYEEWAEDYKREKVKGLVLRDTLALRDFVKDMRMMVTSWDTNTTPLKGAAGASGAAAEEEQDLDDENQHLLKGMDTPSGAAGMGGDVEAGSYYQSTSSSSSASATAAGVGAAASAGFGSSALHQGTPPTSVSKTTSGKLHPASSTGGAVGRTKRSESVESNEASNSYKHSTCAERETLELARRALIEKLQLLAPEQFEDSSSSSSSGSSSNGVAAGANSGGGGQSKRRPSADSEKLSSYLSTDDLPPIIQQLVPHHSHTNLTPGRPHHPNATTTRRSQGSSTRGDSTGSTFELVPLTEARSDSDEEDAANRHIFNDVEEVGAPEEEDGEGSTVVVSSQHNISPPQTGSSRESGNERFSVDSSGFEHTTV